MPPQDSAQGPRPPVTTLPDSLTVCRALEHLAEHVRALAGADGSVDVSRLSSATDACPDVVVICDARGRVRHVNAAAARLTGRSPRELQALSLWDLTDTDAMPDFDLLWRQFLRTGRQRGTYAMRGGGGETLMLAYCAASHVVPELHVLVFRALPQP